MDAGWRMIIAHVVDSMEVGGAETMVLQMCRAQRELGHDPHVYAVAALGALGKQMRAEGFIVQSNLGHHLADAARAFFVAFKQLRPDVVHLHNTTPTIYAALAARIAGAHSIISTRHSLVAPPHNIATEIKYAIAALFCDYVVGICDATVSNLRRLHSVPHRKIVRVYNGTVPLSRASNYLVPTTSGFTLIYVGRLAPVKNHSMLLNAFRIAVSSMPELRLWMVGDGSERESLEQQARDLGIAAKVTFWGQQLDVAQFFYAADAFIMSSKSEGLPMSLLQAFSIGLPAIVTDVGGMSEVVRLANAGYTVDPTDAVAMSAAILQIAGCAEERQTFSRNAKVAFSSLFTLERMVAEYMSLYQKTPRTDRIDQLHP
jgi:glycosyltransferase involved in cell wall biosynthesis